MTTTDFPAYKGKLRAAIRAVLAHEKQGRLDEAAFPAYSHPNPLINWLFWQRLKKTMSYIERSGPYERVLDFGCGSGVLLPFLAGVAKEVVAVDVDTEPFARMQAEMAFPGNIQVYDLSSFSLDTLSEGSFDVITALDVLEHVKDLPGTHAQLLRLLKPGGRLVVSGPTENVFYKIGRSLAGKEYSGDYHERGIAEIRRDLASRASIENIAMLYWPVPLFDLFAAKKR